MSECFSQLSTDSDCRAVIISGAGKMFTAGKTKFRICQQKPDHSRKVRFQSVTCVCLMFKIH